MKNNGHIKKIIIFLLLVIQFSCFSKKILFVKAEINKKTYSFELAVTSEERQKGLMFRKKLAKNSGMLFVYKGKGVLSFYMKNTIIPLDIAFIDESLRIINIEKMEPLDETSINSKKAAQFALEVNRGFFERVNLKEGDIINFLTPIPFE